MPRMISTSCITGTGFMKCMPMNAPGRSVDGASRVIEIDEVLVARIASGFSAGASLLEDLPLDLLVLGGGLDHQVAVADAAEVGAGLDALQAPRSCRRR